MFKILHGAKYIVACCLGMMLRKPTTAVQELFAQQLSDSKRAAGLNEGVQARALATKAWTSFSIVGLSLDPKLTGYYTQK